jgi:arylsulfatase A-like enzyme
VPLLFWYPGHLPAGARVTVPVSTRSLPATILDLAGLPAGAIGGRSLARTWAAPESLAAAAPDTILSEVNYTPGLPAHYPVSKGRLSSIVEEGLRYIRNGDGRAELYDFDHDRGERTDLAPEAERQPAVQRLGASLDRITRRAPSP